MKIFLFKNAPLFSKQYKTELSGIIENIKKYTLIFGNIFKKYLAEFNFFIIRNDLRLKLN